MFPTAADDDSVRTELTDDDRLAVSNLYPAPSMEKGRGNIYGIVYRNGEELPGINVVIRGIGAVSKKIFSTVTGVYEANMGSFEFYGLPAGEYELFIEPVDLYFFGASGVGPYTRWSSDFSFRNPPPPQFYHKDSLSNIGRSIWDPVVVRAGETTSDIDIHVGEESVSDDEREVQILGLNTIEIGGISPKNDALFQYLFVPTGNEKSISIIVDTRQTTIPFELVVKKGKPVYSYDPATASGKEGHAEVILGPRGDLALESVSYFIVVRNLGSEDLAFTIETVSQDNVDSTPTPTPTRIIPTSTKTPTMTPRPTKTPTRRPTKTPTKTPTVRPTQVPTKAPTFTVVPTKAPSKTPTARPITETPTQAPTIPINPTPVDSPSPTPTAIQVNPELGLVSFDEIGGTFPRGAAVHNFDIGITNAEGILVDEETRDGIPDSDVLAPLLMIGGEAYPIAQDMEFSGEIDPDGNGSEGVYYLMGGSLGMFLPPVVTRLGATGGPNNGGIDINNNPNDNVNYRFYKGDSIPLLPIFENGFVVSYLPTLIDLEPAGNDGFYVLDRYGNIYAEGSASALLEENSPSADFTENSIAVDLEIYRGRHITLTNSLYSRSLVGWGAYVLDNLGFIYVVGNAPALNSDFLPPIIMQDGMSYRDMELIPDAQGSQFIGLGIMRGDGIISFVPFADVEYTDEVEEYINSLFPFGKAQTGFSMDIARDFELEISETPIYGLDESGRTVPTSGRRVGIFLFDGFGGIHTGGQSTRYAPAYGDTTSDDIRIIDGFPAVPFPVNIPYYGTDSTRDVELAPRIQRVE